MRIIFTVTNELNYDQRMIRICNSLAEAGNEVKLIGVQCSNFFPLQKKRYLQKRLPVFFKRGVGFYFEYNLRLFFYLLFQRADILCCIDLDTILPVYLTSYFKGTKRVYDAHEYFSQQKEIITRPKIYRFWHYIERTFIPKFKNGYTVSDGIAKQFFKKYQVEYEIIRNVPLLKKLQNAHSGEKIILYQGSVNQGRGFEYIIPAMKNVNAILHIYGDGNFLEQAKSLVEVNQLQKKILFKGKFLPQQLEHVTGNAYIGINLVEPIGENQVLSLANKFFDYMHHCVPQVTMNFPEYKRVNEEHEICVLINNLSVPEIEGAIRYLLEDQQIYGRMKENCKKARKIYNWQNEERKLLSFYSQINNTKWS